MLIAERWECRRVLSVCGWQRSMKPFSVSSLHLWFWNSITNIRSIETGRMESRPTLREVDRKNTRYRTNESDRLEYGTTPGKSNSKRMVTEMVQHGHPASQTHHPNTPRAAAIIIIIITSYPITIIYNHPHCEACADKRGSIMLKLNKKKL